MTRDIFKLALLGAVLSFITVPTILVVKSVVLKTYPRIPALQNLGAVYGLYGLVAMTIFLVIGMPLLIWCWSRGWQSFFAFSTGGIVVAVIGETILIVGGVGFWNLSNLQSMLDNTATLAFCGFV